MPDSLRDKKITRKGELFLIVNTGRCRLFSAGFAIIEPIFFEALAIAAGRAVSGGSACEPVHKYLPE